MAGKKKRDRDSLKNLAYNASDDEIFGGAPPDSDAGLAADALADDDEAPPSEPPAPDDEEDAQPAEPQRGSGRETPDWREETERLFAQGKWQQVCERLGPPEDSAELPPELGLLYATALKECDPDETQANPLAIRSMAELLGLSPKSQTAVILAKRVLRRNPAAWSKRAAPPAHTRILVIVATILIGAVVGWLLGPSGIRIDEVMSEVLR